MEVVHELKRLAVHIKNDLAWTGGMAQAIQYL